MFLKKRFFNRHLENKKLNLPKEWFPQKEVA